MRKEDNIHHFVPHSPSLPQLFPEAGLNSSRRKLCKLISALDKSEFCFGFVDIFLCVFLLQLRGMGLGE